jgi:hypothetical protein
MQIVDVRGEVVYRRDLNVEEGKQHYQFNDIELTPGLYFIRVSSDEKQAGKRILVK